MESYGTCWKLTEGPTSFYVILCHTRVVWSICHARGAWTTIEHSRMFWMMVQGKEEWKKINKVQHLSERGHDILGPEYQLD